MRNSVNIGKLHVFYKTLAHTGRRLTVCPCHRLAALSSRLMYESFPQNSLLQDPWEHQGEVYCLKLIKECSKSCSTIFASPSKNVHLTIILGGELENFEISLCSPSQKNSLVLVTRCMSSPTMCCFGKCGTKTEVESNIHLLICHCNSLSYEADCGVLLSIYRIISAFVDKIHLIHGCSIRNCKDEQCFHLHHILKINSCKIILDTVCTERYRGRAQKWPKNETWHACLVIALRVIPLRVNNYAEQLKGNHIWM